MESQRTCPDCGAPLASNAPHGLCPRCLFELGRTGPPLSSIDDDTTDSPTPLTGATRFGDYELIEEIGRGGMGVVYKARQRNLDRLVALKLLAFGPLASADMIRRFRTEASAAGALHHPNIVGVHEVGLHQGQHYLVMDYVDGPSLATLVRGEPLPVRRAAAYLKTIAEAVHYAHEKGILHRDLKPSNILLGSDDRPRIADFGLARRLDADSTLTLTGQSLGSPSYMPPEQWSTPSQISSEPSTGTSSQTSSQTFSKPSSGPLSQSLSEAPSPSPGSGTGSTKFVTEFTTKSATRLPTEFPVKDPTRDKITRRSDVYALGGILYHLITGRPPFQAGTPAETMALALNTGPVAPRLLNPILPRDLETICLKCLEKEPAKRYSTAQALADDLDRFLNDEPILARPVTRLERTIRWCRRKPALAGSLLLVLVLLLVLGIASPIAAYRIDQARQEAVHQARQARLNQYAADINLAFRSIEARDTGRARHLLEAHAAPGTLEDFRGWEWDYLWAKTRSDAEFRLGEHPDSIRCAAYSPSGSLLASGDLAGNVKLWDLDSRTLLHRHRESRSVHSVAFLSETVLATANQAGRVTFYDVPNLRILKTLNTGASVRAIAVSPDLGRFAWLLGPDGGERLALWELTEAAPEPGLFGMTHLADLPGPDRHQTYIPMGALAFAPNGKELAVGYSDGRILLIDATTAALRQTIAASDQVIATIAYSADGRWLASGAIGTDTAAHVWDVENGKLVATLVGHSRWVSRVTFLAKDTWLLTTSPDQTVRLWNTATWQLESVLQGHTAPVLALAVHPSGERFITGSKDQSLLAWTPTGDDRSREELSMPGLRNFAFSPKDGSLVAIESNVGDIAKARVTMRRAPNYAVARELAELGKDLVDVSFAPRSTYLVLQTSTSLQLWDSGEWRLVKSLTMPDADSWELLGFTEDEAEVLLVNPRFSVRSWDLTANALAEEWSALGTVDPPTYFHTKYAAYHPPSGILVLGSDGAALVWDARTRTLRGILKGHQAAPVAPAISPNGEFIATAGDDGNAFLWDAKSLARLRNFQTPRGSLQSVAFSPDGRRIATGLAPDVVMALFDVETGRELLRLSPGVQMASRIRWSPDGSTLVAQGFQGAVWRPITEWVGASR